MKSLCRRILAGADDDIRRCGDGSWEAADPWVADESPDEAARRKQYTSPLETTPASNRAARLLDTSSSSHSLRDLASGSEAAFSTAFPPIYRYCLRSHDSLRSCDTACNCLRTGYNPPKLKTHNGFLGFSAAPVQAAVNRWGVDWSPAGGAETVGRGPSRPWGSHSTPKANRCRRLDFPTRPSMIHGKWPVCQTNGLFARQMACLPDKG